MHWFRDRAWDRQMDERIGGSRIFLYGGDFGNPSELSERALRGSGLMGE